MKATQPQIKGSTQLFKNPILEHLSKTHIAVPISIFVVYATALLVYSISVIGLPAMNIILLFFTGLMIFTLVEYIVHRYVFHMKTDTPKREKIQYTFHGVHHEFPKDKSRLAMPPVMSITIATILLIGLRFVIGDLTYAFLPGFLVGYASYLFVHYIVHAYQPPRNFFKVLWVHHGIHHYKDNTRAFGVSSPIWDYVFRTMPR